LPEYVLAAGLLFVAVVEGLAAQLLNKQTPANIASASKRFVLMESA
jgi:hypothetical protein